MNEPKDQYAIVLLGGMNPRIHHPSWYQLVNLFDEDEAQEALKSPNTFATPPVAQIQTGKFLIVCQDDRYEIRTESVSNIERIVHIISKVFDDSLPHTPVVATGFNFIFRRETTTTSVGSYLASNLVKAPFGLTDQNTVGGDITLKRSYPDHTSFVVLKSVPENDHALIVHHNFEYRFQGVGEIKLADLYSRRFGTDRTEAEEQTARIVETINLSTRV